MGSRRFVLRAPSRASGELCSLLTKTSMVVASLDRKASGQRTRSEESKQAHVDRCGQLLLNYPGSPRGNVRRSGGLVLGGKATIPPSLLLVAFGSKSAAAV